ncbi:hypothetical protein FRC09_016742 [Ceratobasidium sp. 395]|nr:hypothetical protein FRC09_016742 [Ceratobasidium sp. 395]
MSTAALQERLLNKLPDSPAAKYCSNESVNLGRGECTKDTRTELLGQVRSWACDEKAEKIYWLNGMAGTGKTTIAYSLCKYLQTTQKLGASFFCSQRLPACRDVNRILSSITYRLSRFSPAFRQALSRALERDDDAYNQVLEQQFSDLLAVPLREVVAAFPTNVVIVIDALDECDDQGGVAKVLTTLLSHAARLPVKFFVTSRPEPKIVDQMRKREAEGLRLELRLHELESMVVRQDIATYLRAKLAPAGLSEAELSILVQRSGVLFIYAATVVRFIEFDDFARSKQRLKLVLHTPSTSTNESNEALDELYTTILKTGLELKGLAHAEKEAQATLLRHVVCAREPLSLDVMAGLLQAESTEQVSTSLRPLQSVLSVSESGAIGTLHESFPSYLLNPTRSGRFYCNPGQHHAQMAQRCFSLIKVPNPPFNICKLESSYLLDKEVPDLDRRTDKAIPQALLYACRYWATHLELGDHSHNIFPLLYEFLSERLLLWMEVMNLKKHMWEGVGALRQAQRWCKGRACSDDLQLLVRDAKQFVSAAVPGLVLRSTPHIYISALAFWPKSRLVTKHYLPRFPGLVKVTGTANLARHELTPAIVDFSVNEVWGFACSPNSKHIAFVDKSWGLTIWNIGTGQRETSSGEIMGLNCFAFSHDGLHVMLGRNSGAVWIWDMQTHETMGDPLRCHSKHPIRSIVCSHDGEHICAGSHDNYVYILSRRTGQIIASLPGHTYGVRSVVYSPDGAYIASLSWHGDGAIRIWNVYSSYTLERLLSGNPEAVNSISFSPDGAHVASLSSCRNIIRVWDVRTGEPVGEPLKCQSLEWFTSAQYSPSGLHLVSGLRGGGVYIWDPLTGRILTRLLEPGPGTDRTLTWVTYSPDGEQLLAWSSLGSLHIWDWRAVEAEVQRCIDDSVKVEWALHTELDGATAGLDAIDGVERVSEAHTPQTADKLPECHHQEVSALAYSPDGAYIVSGSDDCTLRIWDVRTGGVVGQPLEGHTASISSVSFSPNGARIVSGSRDKTIRIWDVSTCTMLGAPLKGHASTVKSVSYSPDGAYIASGSWDMTIRIWDAYTGQMVGSPLIGHTHWVNSVSYSPDGAFLVSGSFDSTLRIWDTKTGDIIERPLEGHKCYPVKSAAYSPDGLYIASCSEDTVCVWDAYTGSMVGEPPKLHGCNWLHSISYSSAGANLSFSYLRGAICISHAHTDRDLVQPFTLDYSEARLTSCTFSPDGTHVASGYRDGTIRVSNIHIRQVLDAKMRSHGDWPCAVEPCTCSGQCPSPSFITPA